MLWSNITKTTWGKIIPFCIFRPSLKEGRQKSGGKDHGVILLIYFLRKPCKTCFLLVPRTTNWVALTSPNELNPQKSFRKFCTDFPQVNLLEAFSWLWLYFLRCICIWIKSTKTNQHIIFIVLKCCHLYSMDVYNYKYKHICKFLNCILILI